MSWLSWPGGAARLDATFMPRQSVATRLPITAAHAVAEPPGAGHVEARHGHTFGSAPEGGIRCGHRHHPPRCRRTGGAEHAGAPAGARHLRRHALDDITLPEALFPRLSEKRLRERPSTLYNLYQDEYRITVVRTAQRLDSAAAPREVCKALGLPAGLPVLVIRRVAFAYHDRPVEYRVSYVDTRLHDYVDDTHR